MLPTSYAPVLSTRRERCLSVHVREASSGAGRASTYHCPRSCPFLRPLRLREPIGGEIEGGFRMDRCARVIVGVYCLSDDLTHCVQQSRARNRGAELYLLTSVSSRFVQIWEQDR